MKLLIAGFLCSGMKSSEYVFENLDYFVFFLII